MSRETQCEEIQAKVYDQMTGPDKGELEDTFAEFFILGMKGLLHQVSLEVAATIGELELAGEIEPQDRSDNKEGGCRCDEEFPTHRLLCNKHLLAPVSARLCREFIAYHADQLEKVLKART